MKSLIFCLLLISLSYQISIKTSLYGESSLEKLYDFNNYGVGDLANFDPTRVYEFCPEPDFIVYARGWKFTDEGYFYCGARVREDPDHASDKVGINGLYLKACHIDDWDN